MTNSKLNSKQELTVIQKLYDYIKWVSPLINRLPRDRKQIKQSKKWCKNPYEFIY